MLKGHAFDTFLFQPFRLNATHFDEYKAGRKIDSGIVHSEITFIPRHPGRLMGHLYTVNCHIDYNTLSHKIISDFVFDSNIVMGDGRILCYILAEQSNANITALGIVGSLYAPTRRSKFFGSTEPVTSCIYVNDEGFVWKVSFFMTDADGRERMIEYY